jgi:hypothetical protein
MPAETYHGKMYILIQAATGKRLGYPAAHFGLEDVEALAEEGDTIELMEEMWHARPQGVEFVPDQWVTPAQNWPDIMENYRAMYEGGTSEPMDESSPFWKPPQEGIDYTFEDWATDVEHTIERSDIDKWRLGDMFNFGDRRWGEDTAAQVASALKISENTYNQRKWMSNAVRPTLRRTPEASYSHHRAAAVLLNYGEREFALAIDHAIQNELGVREFTTWVKARKANLDGTMGQPEEDAMDEVNKLLADSPLRDNQGVADLLQKCLDERNTESQFIQASVLYWLARDEDEEDKLWGLAETLTFYFTKAKKSRKILRSDK